MPSNYSSVPPQEVTGTTQLPLSRIKKIIGTDQDINMCSSNAAFVITLATEMFIQYMAESGHNVVKSERKPRRNIQYRDLSSAVSHIDNLEFLSDIVPKTVPLKLVKANAHMANNLAKTKSTVPPTNPPFPQPATSHAGPSAPTPTPTPNSFPQSPLLDTAPPRVSVSGLLEDSASAPASASTSTPALNQVQPQPQPQPPSQPQTQNNSPTQITTATTPAHPITIPNGFTPTNGFTPANKSQKQQEQRRVSTATEDEDPNAQLRMESQANSDDHDEEEEDDDVEMS